MTRPGLELAIFHTRDEHANHYVTDAVIPMSNWVIVDYLQMSNIAAISYIWRE